MVSQLEDPLSLASSAALGRWSGSLRLEAFSASCFLLSDFTLRLILLLLYDGVISEFVLSVKDELSNWATNVFRGLEVGW